MALPATDSSYCVSWPKCCTPVFGRDMSLGQAGSDGWLGGEGREGEGAGRGMWVRGGKMNEGEERIKGCD